MCQARYINPIPYSSLVFMHFMYFRPFYMYTTICLIYLFQRPGYFFYFILRFFFKSFSKLISTFQWIIFHLKNCNLKTVSKALTQISFRLHGVLSIYIFYIVYINTYILCYVLYIRLLYLTIIFG